MDSLMLLAAMAEPSFLQVVAMGLITVFVVLICLIIIIKIMGAIMAGVSKPAPAPAPPPPALAAAGSGEPVNAPMPGTILAVKVAAGPAAPAVAAPTVANAAPQPNKQQLVAAVSAAIAEDMGGSVDHIKIHSIRKL